jgi:hypothetical protein
MLRNAYVDSRPMSVPLTETLASCMVQYRYSSSSSSRRDCGAADAGVAADADADAEEAAGSDVDVSCRFRAATDTDEAKASLDEAEAGISLLGSPLPATDSVELPWIVSFPVEILPNGTTWCHSMSSRVRPDPGCSETYRLDTPPKVSEPMDEANLAEGDGAAELVEAELEEWTNGGASASPKTG